MSVQLPVNQGLVKTEKEFSDALTGELTDAEIAIATRIIIASKTKWQNRFRLKFRDTTNFKTKEVEEALDLVEEFNDEISYRLATEVGVLASVDTTPLLKGEGIHVDILGTVGGPKPMDHDQKEYEVKKAKDKKEDFLGQRSTDKVKAQKRSKNVKS